MIDNKPGAARCELAIYERWDQMSVNPVAGGGLLWKDIWKRAEEASDENVADNERYPVGPFLAPNILKTDCSFLFGLRRDLLDAGSLQATTRCVARQPGGAYF